MDNMAPSVRHDRTDLIVRVTNWLLVISVMSILLGGLMVLRPWESL